jgi:chromosome segregation ATPase
MKAAEFGVKSAKAAVDRAEATATAAKTTVQGWQAVEQHLQLENRRAQLASVQAALEERTQAAQPLQDKVDEARAHLAGALHRELDRAEAEIADLTTQIEAHNNALEAADAEVDAAQQRRTELGSERQTIHSAIDKFDQQKQRLIDRGVLTADETLAAAAHRLTTAAAAGAEFDGAVAGCSR